MERQPETRPLLSADNPPQRDSFERYSLVLLAVTILAAAWLRFHLLTAKSFWFDEGFSVGVARVGWRDFLQLLWHREAKMDLYYLLLRSWMKLGISEFFVRS